MGPQIWTSGPEIEITLSGGGPSLEEIPAIGIVDTGASCVCVDQRILLRLGLTAIDRKQMQVADGTWVTAVAYMARLRVPGLRFDEWFKVFGVKMPTASSRVLLGRSFLQRYHVTYSGPDEIFHWSYAARFYEEHDG